MWLKPYYALTSAVQQSRFVESRRLDALASLFADLKMYRTLSLLLHHRCVGTDLVTYADVLHAQAG